MAGMQSERGRPWEPPSPGLQDWAGCVRERRGQIHIDQGGMRSTECWFQGKKHRQGLWLRHVPQNMYGSLGGWLNAVSTAVPQRCVHSRGAANEPHSMPPARMLSARACAAVLVPRFVPLRRQVPARRKYRHLVRKQAGGTAVPPGDLPQSLPLAAPPVARDGAPWDIASSSCQQLGLFYSCGRERSARGAGAAVQKICVACVGGKQDRARSSRG